MSQHSGEGSRGGWGPKRAIFCEIFWKVHWTKKVVAFSFWWPPPHSNSHNSQINFPHFTIPLFRHRLLSNSFKVSFHHTEQYSFHKTIYVLSNSCWSFMFGWHSKKKQIHYILCTRIALISFRRAHKIVTKPPAEICVISKIDILYRLY